MTCCKEVILFNLSADRKSLRAMAERLLRPLLMVDRLPLNTPAMKRPGSPGMSPATWSTCRGSIWSRVLTCLAVMGSQSRYTEYITMPSQPDISISESEITKLYFTARWAFSRVGRERYLEFD